jgi:hypothetical protein
MVPQPPTYTLTDTAETPLADTLPHRCANRSTVVSRQPDERPAFNRSSYYVAATAQVASLMLWCLAVACVYITWEDEAATYAWPSRHRTLLTLQETKWGMSTVHGMGFGRPERELLLQLSASVSEPEPPLNGESLETDASTIIQDEDQLAAMFMNRLPSYNEVLLRHRTETVVQWQTVPTTNTIREAIHIVVDRVAALPTLTDLARDYQWSALQAQLQSPLWTTDLSRAASILRQAHRSSSSTLLTMPQEHVTVVSTNQASQPGRAPPASTAETAMLLELRNVVGFDWGSCAWRHCGALADVQEALDELLQLLGVLEPYEAIFCLDVVERSLREILALVPWDYADAADASRYASLPPYESKIVRSNENGDDNDDEILSRIDAAYFQALQDLRID